MKRLELTGQRFGSWLVLGPVGVDRHRNSLWSCLCDCGTVATVRGYHLTGGYSTRCWPCARRATIAANTLPDAEVTYIAVHIRLRIRRGRAGDQTCACGKPAGHWAYRHGDPRERLGYDSGNPRRGPFAFTPNLDAYTPMCVPCHKRLDLQHAQEMTA